MTTRDNNATRQELGIQRQIQVSEKGLAEQSLVCSETPDRNFIQLEIVNTGPGHVCCPIFLTKAQIVQLCFDIQYNLDCREEDLPNTQEGELQ